MAAERFGGRYSPQAAAPRGTPAPPPPRAPQDPKPKGRWRTTFLFLSSFAFLFPAFGDAPGAMALGLVAGGLLILSTWLTRQGMIARAAWEARPIARRPAIPRIGLGALATGAALFLGGVIAHGIAASPILFGLLGVALHFGAFGFDPMRDKGMEGVDRFQTDRVARVVTEAEKTLAQMKDAILRARDRQLEARVERFATTVRALFRQVEQDPGDLTAARKYLSVYLQGARDATVKFADYWAQTHDPKARSDYETLLADLETTFADRTRALLADGRTDLDIEIGVLRDRLQFDTPKSPVTPPQA